MLEEDVDSEAYAGSTSRHRWAQKLIHFTPNALTDITSALSDPILDMVCTSEGLNHGSRFQAIADRAHCCPDDHYLHDVPIFLALRKLQSRTSSNSTYRLLRAYT